MRILLCSALLALALPATSVAVDQPPLPPQATVTYSSCPDGLAGACSDVAAATIYLDGDYSRFALEHERGHLFDAQLLDVGERNAIMRVMGLIGPWEQGTALSCRERRCPSEIFADAYATCRMGWTAKPTRFRGGYRLVWTVGYGWQPGPKRQRRTCAIITRAAR